MCWIEPQVAGGSDGSLPDTTVVQLIDRVAEDEWLGRRGVPPKAIWHQVRTGDNRLCWVRQTRLLRLDGGFSFPRNTPRSEIQRRQEMLGRARSWIAKEVAYAPQDTQDGYPADALGYVSYAWLLPPTVDLWDPAAVEKSPYLQQVVDRADLTPGDVLWNETPGAARRAVIFYHWHDRYHQAFQAFEMSGTHGKAIHTVLRVSGRQSGGWILTEDRTRVPGLYRAWGRKGKVGG